MGWSRWLEERSCPYEGRRAITSSTMPQTLMFLILTVSVALAYCWLPTGWLFACDPIEGLDHGVGHANCFGPRHTTHTEAPEDNIVLTK